MEPAVGDKDILRAAAAVSSDRPGYAQFEAMARVLDEVRLYLLFYFPFTSNIWD